jgi:hypothetical protein
MLRDPRDQKVHNQVVESKGSYRALFLLFISNKFKKVFNWIKKPIFKRLVVGFKKEWQTPNIPEHIITLQQNPLIRILRVLGGLSMILIITKRLELLGNGILHSLFTYI